MKKDIRWIEREQMDTRRLVWALIKLVADSASPEQIRSAGRFAQTAINYRRRRLQGEAKLIEALMTR